jgi:hypothetical protein
MCSHNPTPKLTVQKFLSCGVILGLLSLMVSIYNDKTLITSVKSTNNSTNAILNFSCQARLFLIMRLNDQGLKLIACEVLKHIIRVQIKFNIGQTLVMHIS